MAAAWGINGNALSGRTVWFGLDPASPPVDQTT
jgi:hypothetical protein